MDKIPSRHIVTLNLKYGSAAKPLRSVAFAHLVAKALYLLDKPASSADLTKAIADVIEVDAVGKRSVDLGIAYLAELNQTQQHKKGRWSLTSKAKQAIDDELSNASVQLDAVLDRHFPDRVNRETLAGWFNEASAAVFGHFGDDWVASVCRVKKKPKYKLVTLAEHLQPSVEKFDLTKYAHELVCGYQSFLESDDIADKQHLMSLGQAMFSARLVAADIGAEPITLEGFKDAIVILDTNVLFAITLEGHRLASSIAALGKALRTIGVKPVYIRDTADEYGRALEYKRNTILKAVATFSEDVIADTDDDFIASAKVSKCSTVDDFERFFDQLIKVPATFADDFKIQLREDEVVQKAVDSARKDLKLQSQIQSFAQRVRPPWRGKKGKPSLEHDASLLHVTELERREGNKCWVMSIDRSLQVCAVQVAGAKEMPAVVSVDALIEILALNRSGPEFDASVFAPLLARIILMECQPPMNTYTAMDLETLHAMNEAAADLPPERTKEIARRVARARAGGKTIESTELQLEINRMLQEEKVDSDTANRDVLERAKKAEEEVVQQTQRSGKLEKALVKQRQENLTQRSRTRLLRELLWRSVIVVAVGTVIWWVARFAAPNGDSREVVNYAFSAAGLVLSALGLLPKAINNYRRDVKEIPERARKIVHENID